MKNLIYTLALLITFSSYSQQVRQEVVQAQGDVYSAILDTYTGHELLVDTPKKVVFLVKKLLSGNGVVYRHTYDIKEDRFRYTVSMKTMLNGVPQQELDMTSEEEYKKYMIGVWINAGYTEKKANKWYEKYGNFEESKKQGELELAKLNKELDVYRDTVLSILNDNDDW